MIKNWFCPVCQSINSSHYAISKCSTSMLPTLVEFICRNSYVNQDMCCTAWDRSIRHSLCLRPVYFPLPPFSSLRFVGARRTNVYRHNGNLLVWSRPQGCENCRFNKTTRIILDGSVLLLLGCPMEPMNLADGKPMPIFGGLCVVGALRFYFWEWINFSPIFQP